MSRVLLLFTLLSFIGLSVAQAQNKQFTGTVKDKKDGQPLVGVSVALAGTKNGTSTDANGTFKISIPTNGAVLTFTYIGYKTKNVTVTNETKLSVTLDEDANNLEEVTVNVGYGVVRKKDLTGAVGSVGADVIAAAPVSSALEAIQGRVAGINISSTEGSPNAELTVRVRGGGSITGDNSPLYIVDGFPVATIADIAPQDIESIDILKDASSTAIYGSRGANGVILVTTKNSKDGKTNISLNVFGGVRNLAKKLDVLTPYDYVTWQYERALLDKSLTDYTQYFGNYQDIDLYQNVAANDWQEIIFGRTEIGRAHV